MPAWPFQDPENVAVFTTRHILFGEEWIAYVSHDDDDGAWQFHAASRDLDEADAAIVSLRAIFELDPSIGQLSDLPLGWCAWRESTSSPWVREAKEA